MVKLLPPMHQLHHPQSTDDESAEAAAGVTDDEAAEGEAPPSGGGMPSGGGGMPVGGGGGAMPRMSGGGAGGGGRSGGMDALISAAMSQGDPASMPAPMRPPGGASGPRMRGPAMPGSGTPGPAAGDNPQMRAMIQSIYRGAGTDARRGVPTGARGASIPSDNPRPSRKRNV